MAPKFLTGEGLCTSSLFTTESAPQTTTTFFESKLEFFLLFFFSGQCPSKYMQALSELSCLFAMYFSLRKIVLTKNS